MPNAKIGRFITIKCGWRSRSIRSYKCKKNCSLYTS